MDEAFWQQKWESNQIGFHEEHPNANLLAAFDHLALSKGDRIFVPLCGKSVDLDWLLARGCRVVGIEFSPTAVAAVFDRLALSPAISQKGDLTLFSAAKLEIFTGDFFALTRQDLGPVDAIYDRAALVALPEQQRKDYRARLIELTDTAPQLLVSLDYDESQMTGPPFSVGPNEVRTLYEPHYNIHALRDAPISGALAQRCQGTERVWHLARL